MRKFVPYCFDAKLCCISETNSSKLEKQVISLLSSQEHLGGFPEHKRWKRLLNVYVLFCPIGMAETSIPAVFAFCWIEFTVTLKLLQNAQHNII
jgi:hypothetical protein